MTCVCLFCSSGLLLFSLCYNQKVLNGNYSTPSDKKNETSSSQPCISQFCRASSFYLVHDREMLRWYFAASGLTAFNQSLADQDLSGLLPILSVRKRVISKISVLCKRVASLTFTSISMVNDFYYWLWLFCISIFSTFSKVWINFTFSSFLSNAPFWISSPNFFISTESSITLLLLNWKICLTNFRLLKKRFV